MPNDRAGMEIEGMKELGRKFGQLDERKQKRVIRSGVRAGGAVVLKAAKKLVPVRTGRLKKSLGVKVRGGRKGYDVASVGNVKKGGAHAHIVEKGTVEREREGGGPTGHMPARPFLRPAFHENQPAVVEAVAVQLRKQIDRAVRTR